MINVLVQYVFMSILILSMINPVVLISDENDHVEIGTDSDNAIDLVLSTDYFIMNIGQITDDEILFYSSSGNAYFRSDGIMFRIRDREPIDTDPSGDPGYIDPHFTEYRERGVVLEYQFEGSNVGNPEGSERLLFDTNYFKGSDPNGWHTSVPNYREIIYRDLWDGIDLLYRIVDGNIKYDLIVSAGADPDEIEFTIDGHESLSIDRSGDLVLGTGYRNIHDSGLIAFQDGNKISGCSFDIRDQSSYGFQVSDYDESMEFIIDPLLDYSTFIGGGDEESGQGIFMDDAGCVFIVGPTDDHVTAFPTTTGAYNIVNNGNTDVFVTKLSSDGSSLIYSTFIGGSEGDVGLDIFVDENGSAYITGMAENATVHYPTTEDAYCTDFNGGGSDTFVTKLGKNGSSLVYSTFIGGSDIEWSYGITVDDNGNAFITGSTWDGDDDFPTTSGAYQETNSGTVDIYIAKFASDGSDLVYSTMIGGTNVEYGFDICIDDVGHGYITGVTWSMSSYPITPEAYNTTHSGDSDSVVTKLSTDGSSLIYSTFLGGDKTEIGYGICADKTGSAYVTGYTESNDFPTTSGSYDESHNGMGDVFVTKLSTNGSSLIYSTFIGGDERDQPYGLDIDNNGNAYLTGRTNDGSVDYPVSSDAYSGTITGIVDIFFTILGSSGSKLKYSTYIGGSDLDIGNDIRLGNNNTCLITGYSNVGTPGFPTTTDAYDRTHNGYFDVIVMIFDIDPVGPGFGLDITDKICTTGDDFEFGINVSDPSGIAIVKVEYWFGSGIHNNVTMTGTDTYYRTIAIPSDSLDPLSYKFHAASVAGMWSQTSRKGRVVSDNDNPILGEDHSDSEGTTGDDYTFSVSADDNIDVHRVYVDFWFGSGAHQNFSMVGPDPYRITIQVQSGSTSDLKYIYHAVDDAGNWVSSETQLVVISDNDLPEIGMDSSDRTATTGDPFSFNVAVQDNIGIDKVSVEYWFGTDDHMTIEMDGSGTYNATIIIPANSIEILHYKFSAVDEAGYDTITDQFDVEVTDNDPPRILDDLSPDSAGTGDTIEIKIEARDNVAIGRVDLFWRQDTNGDEIVEKMVMRDGLYTASLSLPMDWTGVYFYRVIVTDTSGLTDESGEMMIYLEDDISPQVDPVENISVPVGFHINITVKATDNIGVEYYRWSGMPTSSLIDEFVFSWNATGPGLYPITVEVGDLSGNEVVIIFNIQVLPLDHDTDGDGIPDHIEIEWGLDREDPDDAHFDPDDDGLTNIEEFQAGTLPDDPDSDSDGMPDGWEADFGTDPVNKSSNDDPDKDGLDNLAEYLNGTDPLGHDTDMDGIPDGWEVRYGLDPTVHSANEDKDGDGKTDLDEYLEGTDPTVDETEGGDSDNGDDDITPFIIGAVVGVIILLMIIVIAVILIMRKKDGDEADDSALDDLASGSITTDPVENSDDTADTN